MAGRLFKLFGLSSRGYSNIIPLAKWFFFFFFGGGIFNFFVLLLPPYHSLKSDKLWNKRVISKLFWYFWFAFKSPSSFHIELSPLVVLRVSSVLPTAERSPFMLEKLDIMSTYHYVQNQGKLMMRSRENGQKPQFGHFFDDFEVKYMKNSFYSNWRSYFVITSGQKPKNR